ncbi:acyltransferase family protein [Nonomuraea indica]|uniref:acyltransferase family protein n=1 Tax=Nonomuraea indica TaxID=1581193 RepID=UPI000C7E7B33|nr:acyltransferase [Nonomuraea indica]
MSGALSPPSETLRPGLHRLGWLDALRGVGALAVVGEHLFTWAMPWLRPTQINLGVYGVLVFFLVSGYIVPASLERGGDLRAFWIGRFFRLYPLYLAVLALVLALSWWIPVRPEVPRDPYAAAAHATMLLDVVGVGGVLNTMWTLSYEMVFYLMVAALFAAGAHAGRGLIAVLFGLAAVVTGLTVSAALLTGGGPAWVSLAVFTAGLACVLAGRLRTVASCALGLMALALLFLSGRVPWFGLAMLAVMFAGTAIHHWERGTGTLRPVALTALLVAVAPVWAISAGWWWVRPDVWIGTMLAAAATFAAGLVLRERRIPRPLTWLGLVSYSLYLVHLPILLVMMEVLGERRWSPLPHQIATGVGFVLVLLPVSALTHRLIEQPMQRIGRRLVRDRLGPGPR